ncbi:MAG: phosphatase family protein [Thermoleophilia bacterium]|nr:phosphatase family protein [Thermoleophilia bacterium]
MTEGDRAQTRAAREHGSAHDGRALMPSRDGWRRLALSGCVLFAAALLIGVLVTQVGAPPFDRWLTLHVASWRNGFGGAVFRFATRVGYATWLVPMCGVCAVVAALQHRPSRQTFALLLTPPLTAVVNVLLKHAFTRERPQLNAATYVEGFSMPSGHAAVSASFAVAVMLVFAVGRARVPVAGLALLFMLVVGTSRVVLGVHWATDVLAGWCEGAALALLVAALMCRLLPPRAPRGTRDG